jgi:hypothetical protein
MRLLSVLIVLLLSLNFQAKAGDTTTVTILEDGLWTWYGNIYGEGSFPNNKTYRKVTFKYTLGCPDGGCSDWDYSTSIYLRKPTGELDTAQNMIYNDLEIARVMTPYGGYWSDPREQTYEFDLTDYQHLLKDSVSFRCWYGGWSAGWNLNLEMEMIEGTPPRTCNEIIELWDGEYKYGVTDTPISTTVTPQTTAISSETKGLRMRSLLTGHSFGGNENCAEFCPKTHQFVINDQTSFDQYTMRDDCGFNPVYPQNGTWIYNRAGWCPGLDVNWYEYEMTDLFTAGEDFKVDYQFDSYTYNGQASFDPNYRIATYLYLYDEPFFENDAEISDIISPSTKTAHSRLNPICGSPQVKIRNTGSNTITSVNIVYGVKGGVKNSYLWTGSLEFMEEEVVTLDPMIHLSNLQETGSIFEVYVERPNDDWDNYAENDTMFSNFEMVDVWTNEVMVWFKPNSATNETSYTISDQDGNIVAQSGSNLSSSIYRDTLQLEPGCYKLNVVDTDNDGLSWWANNDGGGFLQIRGDAIKAFESDFGSGFQYEFSVGQYLSVAESKFSPMINVYPNPSKSGVFNFEAGWESSESIQIEVFNLAGQSIFNKTIGVAKEHFETIDISSQAKGMYVLRVLRGTELTVRKIVID